MGGGIVGADAPAAAPPARRGHPRSGLRLARRRRTRLGLGHGLVVNLGLLGFLALLAELWAGYYTDWSLGRVNAVLGSSLISSYLAVVFRTILRDRQRRALFRVALYVLGGRRCTAFLAALLTVGIVGASFFGTVEVIGAGGTEQLTVTAGSVADILRARALAPEAHARFLFTSKWWSRTEVRVKVSGYPALQVAVTPLRRTSLAVPGAFTRHPVILLRPEPGLFQALANNPMILRVWVIRPDGSRVERTLEPFRGQPVLIGCDADVRPRGPLGEVLARDLHRPGMSALAALDEPVELRPDDQIDVWVVYAESARIENNTVYTRAHFKVRRPPSGGDVPSQVEPLYADEVRFRDLPRR